MDKRGSSQEIADVIYGLSPKCLMCGKSIDYDQSEMRRHFRTRHEGWSLENYYDNFIRKKQVFVYVLILS